MNSNNISTPTCCFALITGLDLKSLPPAVDTDVCSFLSRVCDLRKGILGRLRCRGARGRNWRQNILHPDKTLATEVQDLERIAPELLTLADEPTLDMVTIGGDEGDLGVVFWNS